MTKTVRRSMGKAKLFVAGMGTVLSVAPSIVVASPNTTNAERLAYATNRVGQHFVNVLTRQGSREQKEAKQKKIRE